LSLQKLVGRLNQVIEEPVHALVLMEGKRIGNHSLTIYRNVKLAINLFAGRFYVE